MLQRLRRHYPPRWIQNRHPAYQIPETRINKMPRRKRVPGLHRIKGARDLDEAVVERVLFANPLQAIFLAEKGYMAPKDIAPGVSGGYIRIADAEIHLA